MIVAANWKMNPAIEDASRLAAAYAGQVCEGVTRIVFPRKYNTRYPLTNLPCIGSGKPACVFNSRVHLPVGRYNHHPFPRNHTDCQLQPACGLLAQPETTVKIDNCPATEQPVQVHPAIRVPSGVHQTPIFGSGNRLKRRDQKCSRQCVATHCLEHF